MSWTIHLIELVKSDLSNFKPSPFEIMPFFFFFFLVQCILFLQICVHIYLPFTIRKEAAIATFTQDKSGTLFSCIKKSFVYLTSSSITYKIKKSSKERKKEKRKNIFF